MLRFAWCINENGNNNMDGFTRQYEALTWLEGNQNPSAFSSNRFKDTADAIAFVRTLYGSGAKEVLISNILDEPWRIEEEGGPYADLMLVVLPSDKAQQEQVIRIYHAECSKYFCNDGNAEAGIRGDTLMLWWD